MTIDDSYILQNYVQKDTTSLVLYMNGLYFYNLNIVLFSLIFNILKYYIFTNMSYS